MNLMNQNPLIYKELFNQLYLVPLGNSNLYTYFS